MKKEIWLTEEELNSMLQGTMVWKELVSRLNVPAETSVSEESSRIRRLGEPLKRPDRMGFIGEKSLLNLESDVIPEGSKKVVSLLVGIGILTFGLWFYFISIG